MGLNYMGPLIHEFFPINTHDTVNVFSLLYDFLNHIFFLPDYLILRILYIRHVIYKMFVGKASRQQ